MKHPRNHWFKRKRYGYGWVPASKAGWIVIVTYILTVLLASTLLIGAPEDKISPQAVLFLGIFAIATVLTVSITAITGPKAKWRWGKKPGDNPREDS